MDFGEFLLGTICLAFLLFLIIFFRTKGQGRMKDVFISILIALPLAAIGTYLAILLDRIMKGN